MSRESHYFLGRRYLLNVIERDEPSRVVVRHKTIIDLYVPKGTGHLKRQQVLIGWYRKELKALIPPLIGKWEALIGVKIASWGVKKMKTKWGSCNNTDNRIWVNLELAKKPVQCLEYIVVHEMVHLLERHHNDRFIMLMDKFLPNWRLHRDELNSAPLAHETWSY